MRYVEIEKADLERLFSAIEYVLARYKDKDQSMCDYLAEVKKDVSSHLENEQKGSEKAAEIDVILDFIKG
jgi:hypothetical protein